MDSYYFKRIGQALLVYIIAITVVFVGYRMLPQGPIEILRARLMGEMFGQSAGPPSAEQIRYINQLVESYTNINPEKPIYVAYFDYMRDIVLHQDFGTSIYRDKPVFEILLSRMPWSIFISIYGLALGRTTSLLLGAGMAYNEGTRIDKGLTVFSIVNGVIPYFIVAIVMLIIFSYWLGWFPQGGRYDTSLTPGFNLPFFFSTLKHGTLPIISAYVAGFGGALAFRGNCIREMEKTYIRVARLRGVTQSRLAIRYIGRNAILPIYTGIMMGIASIFSSSLILEVLFNYPAVGFVTYQALLNRDYPLLMGSFIFFTGMTLTGILIADLTYGIIDPRVKGGDSRESF